MKKTAAILALCFASGAFAESWTGPDKETHALVGSAVGASAALKFESAGAGCAAAAAVGAAKEIYDAQNRRTHTPSAKDFVVTAAFGCLSAFAVRAIVSPGHIRFTWDF